MAMFVTGRHLIWGSCVAWIPQRYASRLFFARGAEAFPDASPETVALLAEKDELEDRIASLRAQKDSLAEELYLEELQTLLVALAENREAIDALQEETHDDD